MLRRNRYWPGNDNPPYPAFTLPHEVVQDESLTLERKREILSHWASDACAVASMPTLRRLPGTPFPVTFSSIMDARAQLDRLEEEGAVPASLIGRMKRGSGNQTGA